IYISRTVSTTEDGKKIIGPTKTNDKYRRIDGLPMSDKLVDVLKNYRENFSNAESDFIFCNRSGDYYNTSITNSWLDKIYKENPDLKRITTHGLRHTLASLLFESDQTINPQEVQYMLGHSDVKTTLDIYTTVTKKRKDRLKRSVNSLKI
ncbi:MAG: site-specific integrase, partial [Lactobacillus johnsonii]|nr:site-specific integrase [Lactobacillus johnsonii]